MSLDSQGNHAVQELLDKQAIYECIVRYCRGTDRHDRDLIASQYHPDGIDDHGVERTGEEWADRVMEYEYQSTTWVHHLGQVLIDLHGDHAFVESHWVAYRSGVEAGKQFLRSRGGRYADWFERRDGVWKVRRRRIIDDWSNVQVVEQTIDDPSGHVAFPYPDDPIYLLEQEILGHVAELPER